MKKLIYILSIIVIVSSCENQGIEFPDYEYNAVYFPLQYPVRTLVLGDDRIDNSRDKELRFLIGAVIGGMYENTDDWHIDYIVDETLAENLINPDGDTIRALPAAYYTLNPAEQILIPAGSFSGIIEVQLTEDFLSDSLAITGNYVIPLRMTNTDADSMLTGVPNPMVDNPDRRRASDWDSNNLPKDYVLFGIKYINPYHGNYFQRGRDIGYEADGTTPASTVIYRNKYVEYDQIRKISTIGRLKCQMNGVGRYIGGTYSLILDFQADGSIIVDSVSTSPMKATGTGTFMEDGGTWGGEPHNAIILEYEYQNNNLIHRVNDTLVFRNNGVVFEENRLTVID